MEFLQSILDKASKRKKTILLPESSDERVLKAAEVLTKNNVASIITLGNEEKIRSDAEKLGVDLISVKKNDPEKSYKPSDFTNIYFNLRKKKGITIEQARETVKRDLFFAAMMVKEGMADGSVGGSLAATADVLRAGIQCIGVADGISIVSSYFIMVKPEKTYTFQIAELSPNPDASQLADIAISAAGNHKRLTEEEPYIAMLSFSTKGSAQHETVDKVIEATKLVKERRPDLKVDGELQFDTAVVDSVGKEKLPAVK